MYHRAAANEDPVTPAALRQDGWTVTDDDGHLLASIGDDEGNCLFLSLTKEVLIADFRRPGGGVLVKTMPMPMPMPKSMGEARAAARGLARAA